MPMILVLTAPNSSPRSTGSRSNSPAEMRSSCAEMRSIGAREARLTIKASRVESRTEAGAFERINGRALSYFLAAQGGVAGDQDDAVQVANGDFVDGGGIADGGFH